MVNGQRVAMYGGLGLVAFASVGLSVVLTRLYSAALGHHLAFAAVALALFGAGIGGGLVALVPALTRPPMLFRRMSLFAGVAAVATIVTVIKTMVTKPPDTLDMKGLGSLAILYAISSIPFVCIGVVAASALKSARRAAATIYFVDMTGAAAGGLGALLLLHLGAPRAGLAIAILLAVAAAVLACGSLHQKGEFSPSEQRGGGWAAAAVLCSTVAVFAGDYGEQWLTVRQMRFVQLERAQFVKWTELALVTVDRPVGGIAWLRLDASAATGILAAKNSVQKHPAEMGYVLSGAEGPALVIGAGGGREIRAAVDAGQTEIVAVEINRTIVNDVMRGKLAEFSGNLYLRPEVHPVVADGRSFIRSDRRLYRTIVLSLVDTWSAASVGGMALSEDGLYTVQAFRDLLARLDPKGSLVINRWDLEFERLLALASAALLAEGVQRPQSHMFACAHDRTTALLIAKSPLDDYQLAGLRSHCTSEVKGRTAKPFVVVFSPDSALHPFLEQIAADPYRAQHEVKGRDISPPTDDRPFFFYTVPPQELLATLADRKKLATEQHGLLMATTVFIVSIAGALLFFLLPAIARPRELALATGRASRLRLLAFFGVTGFGFALVEIGLAQILTVFLGHPVYALTTVLTSLLLGAGVGSFIVRRVPPSAANLVAGRRGQILSILLVAAALGLLPLTGMMVGMPFAVRFVLALVIASVLGLLMGAFTPLGVAIASSRSSSLVAWGWAMNGFFGVAATSVAMLTAMNLGYSFVLFLAAAAYFVASAIVPPAAARPPMPSNPAG